MRVSLPLSLERRSTANGGYEFFLALDGRRVYAARSVGVFTEDPDPSKGFRKVMDQWDRASHRRTRGT